MPRKQRSHEPQRGITIADTDPDEYNAGCAYDVQKKVGGRWTHTLCGEPATHMIKVYETGTGADVAIRFPLCQACLGRLTKKFVGFLE